MSTDLTPAIFGLVGVVVGAIVTGGAQVFLDWLHECRAVKRAKRLVSGELLQTDHGLAIRLRHRAMAAMGGYFASVRYVGMAR